MLTENRLPQFVRQVVNAQRANRPSINVSPADGAARKDVANIIEGVIRHIERWSRADLAYDNAFEGAVSTGVGYFRIATEYVDDMSDEVEVVIRPIENSFSVYEDPSFAIPDGSDRKYVFVTEWVDRDEFEREYGFEATGIGEVAGLGDDATLWFKDERVQVAEYWRVVKEGRAKKVEQYLMTGDKIIKKSDWAGKYLPIVPVYGEVKSIEGKKYRKSLIRDAKESQKVANFYLSAEVEATALQPKAPWVGPAGSFETDHDKWANSNAVNHAYLQYNIVEGGMPPQRVDPPMFPAALRETRVASIEAMKAIMGLYDASLGARSNETSGVAIEARAQQGNLATYHYLDNMTRAIRYAGHVIVDLLPSIYDAPRVVRILQPDGQEQMVKVNEVFIDPQSMQQREYPLALGRYDVVVKAGPSFQTQRQEASAKLGELAGKWPELRQVAGDLLAKNLDIPEADKIAERLRPQSELPPQVQMQMQQMQQAMQQAQQQIQQMQAALTKAALDLEQEQVNKSKVEVSLRLEQAKNQLREEQAKLAAGDPAAEEVLRLREENAVQSVKLVIKDLEKQAMKLDQKAMSLEQRASAVAQQEATLGMQREEEEEPEEQGEPEPTMRDVLDRMVQALTAPRRVIRGADGRAEGVESVIGNG